MNLYPNPTAPLIPLYPNSPVGVKPVAAKSHLPADPLAVHPRCAAAVERSAARRSPPSRRPKMPPAASVVGHEPCPGCTPGAGRARCSSTRRTRTATPWVPPVPSWAAAWARSTAAAPRSNSATARSLREWGWARVHTGWCGTRNRAAGYTLAVRVEMAARDRASRGTAHNYDDVGSLVRGRTVRYGNDEEHHGRGVSAQAEAGPQKRA